MHRTLSSLKTRFLGVKDHSQALASRKVDKIWWTRQHVDNFGSFEILLRSPSRIFQCRKKIAMPLNRRLEFLDDFEGKNKYKKVSSRKDTSPSTCDLTLGPDSSKGEGWTRAWHGSSASRLEAVFHSPHGSRKIISLAPTFRFKFGPSRTVLRFSFVIGIAVLLSFVCQPLS